MSYDQDELQMAIARHFARKVREDPAKEDNARPPGEMYAEKIVGFPFMEEESDRVEGTSAIMDYSPRLLEADVAISSQDEDEDEPAAVDNAYEVALARLVTASRTFERAGREFHRKRAKLASLPFPWIAPLLRLLIAAWAAILMYGVSGNDGLGGVLADPASVLIASVMPVAMALLSQLAGEGAGKAITSWLSGRGFWSALASTLAFLFHISLFGVLVFVAFAVDLPHIGIAGFGLALVMGMVFALSFAILPWIGGNHDAPAALYREMRAAHKRQKTAHGEALEAMRQVDLVHAARKQAAAAPLRRSRNLTAR